MPQPSFPPDSIRAPLVVRRPLPGAGGHALVVGESEAAVFVQSGRVLGTLGPGTHLLDPRAVPFLQPMVATNSGEAFVVALAVHGVRIGGSTGAIFDGASGLALAPRIFGEVGVRIVDAGRAAVAAASAAGGDPDGTVRGYVLHAIVEGAKAAMVQAGHEGRLVRLLTDRAAQPELAAAIAAVSSPRLAEIGVEISAFGSVVVALSEEDMAKINALDVTAPMAPVYEMLWDCKFCGKKKLLGLTHRHCPSCGAPQNAEERYFPADSEKVPAKDHEYYGADLRCASCGVANGRKAKHCGGCGAPLEKAPDIAQRREQVVAAGTAFAGETAAEARHEHLAEDEPVHAPKPPSRVRPMLQAGCLTVLALALTAIALSMWKKPGGLEVAGHTWKREIDVERFGPVSDSAWCDQTPAAARSITRRRQVRSHERVPDGQTCQTHKVDRGNGTFVEKEECTPRYRDEPVYGDRCYYTVDRWAKARSAEAEGKSVADAPRWPDPAIARSGVCDGCEREGARTESYTVLFKDEQAGEHPCTFDEQRWASFTDGSRWKGAIGVVGSSLDCSTVATP